MKRGMSHVGILRKSIPDREIGKCKGPGVGIDFAGSRNSQKLSVNGDACA